MKLTDIISLAKAGYSIADVKELISLADEKDEKQPPENNDSQTDKSTDTNTDNSGNINTDNKDENSNRINELEEQVKNLTAQLAAAQNANSNKDQSSNYKAPDSMGALIDFFRKG